MFRVVILVLAMFVCGCADNRSYPYKIENVTRVIVGGGYSVVTEDPETHVVKVVAVPGSNTTLIADVPIGQPMWVDVVKDPQTSWEKSTIHIHSTKDIVGGSTGGKHPQKVHVIE